MIILRLLPIMPREALIRIARCAAEEGYVRIKSVRFGKCKKLRLLGNHDVSMGPKLVLPRITITAVIINRFDSKLLIINALYAADAIKKASSENIVDDSGVMPLSNR
jgi:hypothetical protein